MSRPRSGPGLPEGEHRGDARGGQVSAGSPQRAVFATAGLVLFLVACGFWLRLRPGEILRIDTLKAIGSVVERLWPPSVASLVLRQALRGIFETLSISIVGTFLGAVLGIGLAPFCSRILLVAGPLVEEDRRGFGRWTLDRLTFAIARLLANGLRTVPYFVWAIFFWFVVGLGPFPGALAIAVHSGGVFARLYSSALEQCDRGPLEALRSTGARRTHILLFGLLPVARPALVSYTLYRWEVNIRESAVLGLVGAGGLGFHISYAIGTFDWSALGTYLIAVMLLVMAVDALSARMRRGVV